jgi:hypothetical protein
MDGCCADRLWRKEIAVRGQTRYELIAYHTFFSASPRSADDPPNTLYPRHLPILERLPCSRRSVI